MRASLRTLAIALMTFAGLSLSSAAWAQSPHVGDAADPCPSGKPVPSQLKLPATLPVGEPVAFEKQLLSYLNTLDYRKLGWCDDKWLRDTGPFMAGNAAIVHPVVHIYYSPEVSRWLANGRKGEIPDGAVIIKEQFGALPAARYAGLPIEKAGCSNDWSIMIKNSKASRDGWFWGEVWNSTDFPMNFSNPYQYPNAGYGLYCLRCHASAQAGLTFSALNNIKGAPGWPLQYRTDGSWRYKPTPHPSACGAGTSAIEEEALKAEVLHEASAHGQNVAIEAEISPDPAELHPLFKAMLNAPAPVQQMPPETLDDVLAAPRVKSPVSAKAPSNTVVHKSSSASRSLQFLTSPQCLGCHSGLSSAALGPTMVLPAYNSTNGAILTSVVNVSPYGEWRWSPMGLAGRDPVFYSQIDSEFAYLKDPVKKQLVIDTCMNCHGAMGKRSYAADHPGEPFRMDFVFDTNQSSPTFKYGSLARDGISCEVCHRMAQPKDPSLRYFLANKINGVFDLTPPGELHGPFKDDEITTYPMDTALGVKPRYSAYIKTAQMCGSCHTILLPILDQPDPTRKSVEQNTYVEWLNSSFRDEYGSIGATPRTCQDCHMPHGYVSDRNHMNVSTIQDKIAIVQDQTYPQAENLSTPDQLNVRYRTAGYVRHELLGTNGFLLQMFLQPVDPLKNNETLGVRLPDYMTGFMNDLSGASDNIVQQARSITATTAITRWEVTKDKLIVEVTVTNLAGHRFPSGVGFRRAFLELQATIDGKPFFTSGTTNELGQITDFNGKVLPTETFQDRQYQPHFSQLRPITSSSQVQIYEELTKDAEGNFTTEFTRRDEEVKDNRLLPLGWSANGPADLKIPEPYLDATHPVGEAAKDPVYLAGKGQSIVRYEIPLPRGASASNLSATVSLYSQTMPPYFLAERSRTKTPATGRLDYLTKIVNLDNTDYKNWKLLIASTKR